MLATVTLPNSIPVRYTEEDAGYVTVRPVVRQTFRIDELLDMILSVTGKDGERVQKILKSGTVVYHFFRYWWAGFDADTDSLAEALRRFPDSNPSREFRRDECSAVIFESVEQEGAIPKCLLELGQSAASQRRLFRRQSFWERLLEIAANAKPSYQSYSYAHRADVYRLDLDRETAGRIAEAAKKFATRNQRAVTRALPFATRLELISPRSKVEAQNPQRRGLIEISS
jgi:hypothetical protein